VGLDSFEKMTTQRRRRETNSHQDFKALFVEKHEIRCVFFWEVSFWAILFLTTNAENYVHHFSSQCPLIQWQEQNRVEKHEKPTSKCSSVWIEEAFLNSFLDWIKDKIVSRQPGQPRVLFEMICGSLHIDVILHKGQPANVSSCMYFTHFFFSFEKNYTNERFFFILKNKSVCFSCRI
jgi:hypothetical protein